MAVAAAATAPGGAAMYPTVVGDTGGLRERKGEKLLQKPNNWFYYSEQAKMKLKI